MTVDSELIYYGYFRINDLVVIEEDQFYVTNDYVWRHRFLRILEYFSFLPIGNVVYYDGQKGRKVASNLRRANGINVSPDKKYFRTVLTLQFAPGF